MLFYIFTSPSWADPPNITGQVAQVYNVFCYVCSKPGSLIQRDKNIPFVLFVTGIREINDKFIIVRIYKYKYIY